MEGTRMPQLIARRISKLEQALQFPPEARLFIERAHAYARRTFCSYLDAAGFVASKASDEELEILREQFEWITFGEDTAARDSEVRQNPNWDFSNGDRK
jgi:hypothetical protein